MPKTQAASSSAGPPLDDKPQGKSSISIALRDTEACPEAETVSPQPGVHWNVYTCVSIAGAYLILLLNSLQMTVVSSLAPYVTSAFSSHSLLPVTSLISSVVTGVIQLPLSRIIDRYGRPQGLIAMIVLDVLGLIIMATCTNVLYYVGADGVIYIIRVFAMDKATVETRSLVYGLSLYTYFITPFAGPALAQAYYKAGIWRWAFGSLAIIIPGVSGTLTLLFVWNEKRRQVNQLKESRSGEKTQPSIWKTVWFHILDLDVLGVLLACFGLGLILLPLSLATKGMKGWGSPATICMVVVGVFCLVALAVYESRFAPRTFIDFGLLRDRTAWGACLCMGGQSLSLYMWWSYYTSFLQVVHFQNIKNAGYILNTHQIGSAVFSVLTGLALKYTHRFKVVNAAGFAITTLGTGLMIHFSLPESPFGGVLASHVLISMSSGMLAASEIAAVLNDTDDGTFSMRVALLFLFSWVGSAIGSTIATPMWRSRFPYLLEKYLPSELKSQAQTIYGSLEAQLSYDRGTPGRDAIIKAMTETWKYMAIGGTATLAVAWIGVLLLKEGKPRDGGTKKIANSGGDECEKVEHSSSKP
ncbi:hypothetical protein AK830_g6705 [Neonectria ditissima]|uniref:Siderophore iron transporter mirB n=1 Tax=Neonectria ditissima TaxID=78410 RepID=A0A0P7B1C0_9HYPO|nr:hypothetical protein AK830_g6705 [Neonectria ditissima]